MTYRHSTYEVCSLCGERATLCCRRCSRPFCSSHGIFGDKSRCADCEAHYSGQKDARDFVAALSGVGTAAVAAAAFLSVGTVSLIWVPFTVLCGALGGALVGGPWNWMKRRRFLRDGRGESVIAEALTINPNGGGRGAGFRKHSSGWQHRDRGNLPSVPIYQRTYGH